MDTDLYNDCSEEILSLLHLIVAVIIRLAVKNLMLVFLLDFQTCFVIAFSRHSN